MTKEFVRGFWVVAYREIVRLVRDRSRMISSFAMPILFLIIFGAGFNRTIGGLAPGVNFIQFLFPGIVAQTVFMNSIFSGLSVVWDREFGFLRELLIAPISRTGIVFGKMLGGAGVALAQGILILALAPFVKVTLTVALVLKLLPLLALLALTLSSLGILLATRMRSQQGFQVLMQLLIFPMIFISGVFFPLNNVPGWLKAISELNPLTYGVDAIRQLFLAGQALPGGAPLSAAGLGLTILGHTMTLWEDVLVMAAVGAVLMGLAVASFSRQE